MIYNVGNSERRAQRGHTVELENLLSSLKANRIASGISGVKVARALGISKQQYHDLENRKNKNFEKKIGKLVSAYREIGYEIKVELVEKK
jgi:transcriptional regulator with XRE-family HTH domain